MSLQPNLTSYMRNLSRKNVRTFAAAAAAKIKEPAGAEPFLPREEPKTSGANGVTVTTVETNRPVSRLAVFLKAGARYENEGNGGVVHALRIAAGSTTKNSTRFGITRSIEAVGGNLSCSVGREHVAYTLEATRDNLPKIQRFLKEVSVAQVFKPWEVTDSLPRLKYELQSLAPEIRVLEALHKAAFRRGLGNSLYAPKHRVSEISSGELQDFVKENFGEAVVVGVGVSQEDANGFAATLGLSQGDSRTPPCASKFSPGGESRKQIGGDLAYVAIAVEGAGLNDTKASIASAVAQRALGLSPRTKRGLPVGRLSGLNGDQSSVSAISANYSDAGLLGVFLAATPSKIGDLTRKAVDTLREVNVSEDDVRRAKSVLKADVALAIENEAELVEDLGLQSLLTGKALSYSETVALIDSVTAADVKNVLKKGGGKIVLAAYGNIGQVPYLDEL